jgi:hypothetical protein
MIWFSFESWCFSHRLWSRWTKIRIYRKGWKWTPFIIVTRLPKET